MDQPNVNKVLITGANGFIGNTLMRYYKQQGTAVVGVDLCANGDDIVQGDISRPETISHLLEQCDVIVHTAALVSNAMKDSDMWRVNVLATRNLIAAAKQHRVRRFVQISSIVAYGNTAQGELDEDHPVHADGGKSGGSGWNGAIALAEALKANTSLQNLAGHRCQSAASILSLEDQKNQMHYY